MAAMRSAIFEVRMSTRRDACAGIRLNRTRVPPLGSRFSRSRLTSLVAKLALALGRRANSSIRSATLSDTIASAEQSLFSPMS